MKIRQAILKAPDHIDGNPGDFCFSSVVIQECGTPGCAIGWIGHFLVQGDPELAQRVRTYSTIYREYLELPKESRFSHPLPSEEWAFYNRMDALAHRWIYDAATCALALRLYADKYHPAPVKLPDWNALASEPLPAGERVSA